MGWLSEEVEASIAAWFDAHSTDGEGALLAEHVMRWTRSTLDGNQLTPHLSIQDLLDSVEGPDEHQLHISGEDWKMTHPLTCRMRGLTRCTVEAWPDLMDEGTWALRSGEWVRLS